MKVLVLTPYSAPEQSASSHLGKDRNEAFVKNGIDVLAYTPTPCRGLDKETIKKYRKPEYRKEILLDGHREIRRFPMYAEGTNSLLRAFRYFCIGVRHFFCGISKDARQCDVMFIASTPPFQGALAGLIKKFTHQPIVYNLQDIFPDSLVGTGLAKKEGLLWKIGRKIENFTYKHADKIIVIGEDFKRNIMAKGVPEEKIEVIYNWVDENAVVPVAKEDNPLFGEFGISRDKFHVVYAGNLGNAQNIDVIIDAAKELADDKNIEFLIFGTGGLKEQFVEKVKSYGIDNVRFFPLQPMERVSQVYGLGDVCVVSCKPGLGGAAMPSKMLSIMSAGRAVVASFDQGELTYILEQNNCGAYAPAGDVKAFAELIRNMECNREVCQKMGENARQLILQKFTREVGTQKYVEVIKSVVNGD